MPLPEPDPSFSATGVLCHQEVPVSELPDLAFISAWIIRILKQEARPLQSIYYMFLDDAALLKLNRDHLQHDTLTDIITFPYSTNPIEAEIYISADRVRENAKTYRVPVQTELLRVMAHGVLHLCGWNDKTDGETRLMRKREDACLALAGIHIPVSIPSPS